MLTANGRGFSSGADVQEWSGADGERDPLDDNWVVRMHRLMSSLYRFPSQ